MGKLDSELAYFRMLIGQKYGGEIAAGRGLPENAIRQVVDGGPFASLTPADRDSVVRELEQNFTVIQAKGPAIRQDFVPWLNSRRQEIDWYYWSRLNSYYLQGNILPPRVVATLHTVTDEILDYAGNPGLEQDWKRRGMVIGHVQSGKTTNYSALICKAADAGYKVIILLAGITNSLRSQTQERLDETFIGKKSVFNATISDPLPIQSYAMKHRIPAYGTSRDQDFTKEAAAIFVNLAALNEPVIFVLKKNKKPLDLLHDWLKEQSHGNKLSYPVLLIDDEADNASINTAKDPARSTAINALIRKILECFSRSTYIGYTATPFANIFIDPDTSSEMLGEDLFPRHFIKALDPPSNYVGADRMFTPDGDLRRSTVRIVDDYEPYLPLKHKSTLNLSDLPPSLLEAIRVFALSRAIRFCRGHATSHCSMMINVSRFNRIQDAVHGEVYTFWSRLKSAIDVNAGLSPDKISDPDIVAVRKTFESEFGNCGLTFETALRAMPKALSDLRIVTVNMQGGSLEYSRNKADGLRVIAIGGLALSRGLTLEDLTVSYILRNTAASDTLMQMARWFGYRPGFEDLCRLYLPQESLDHYDEVTLAINELREEINRMEKLGQTPSEFGLKVRQSETALRITAANKMQSAVSLVLARDFSCRHVEGHALINDKTVNEANTKAITEFLASIGPPATGTDGSNALIWRGQDGRKVVELLSKFRFSPFHPDLGTWAGSRSLLMDYVSDRLSADLKEWDVAVPCLARGEKEPFAGLNISLRSRNKGTVDNGTYRVTGSKNRVADPTDARLVLSPEQISEGLRESEAPDGRRGDSAFCFVRKRPLLIIHVFKANEREISGLLISNPIVSLSFCLPATEVRAQEHSYQVNKVYAQQLEARAEPDDDEIILETGNA